MKTRFLLSACLALLSSPSFAQHHGGGGGNGLIGSFSAARLALRSVHY